MADINDTLNERGARYGRFSTQAEISQGLKDLMRVTPNWDKLQANQKEALEMIAHKIARILNGDIKYQDSWHDGAGYFTLIADYLNGVDK